MKEKKKLLLLCPYCKEELCFNWFFNGNEGCGSARFIHSPCGNDIDIAALMDRIMGVPYKCDKHCICHNHEYKPIRVINLTDYIDNNLTALVGRKHGECIHDVYPIPFETLEKKFDKIIIIIPQQIITINKSFFEGLFKDRVQALGKFHFKNKYQFKTTNHIKEKISKYIDSISSLYF